MKDPYLVLGVTPDASEEEIKRKYRNLSRKYHPDANVNNPNKEKAEEQFKEVQQAYQMIMDDKMRGFRGRKADYGSQGFGNFGGFWEAYEGKNSSFNGEDKDTVYLNAALKYIRGGDYQAALRVLSDIEKKTGRWYYISAIANHGAGNQARALEHIQIAMRMEPNNIEYQRFYDMLQNGGVWYTSRGAGYGMPPVDSADFCFKLCLANLFCNICCGGGCCPRIY